MFRPLELTESSATFRIRNVMKAPLRRVAPNRICFRYNDQARARAGASVLVVVLETNPVWRNVS